MLALIATIDDLHPSSTLPYVAAATSTIAPPSSFVDKIATNLLHAELEFQLCQSPMFIPTFPYPKACHPILGKKPLAVTTQFSVRHDHTEFQCVMIILKIECYQLT
ncbi:hypothetical protein HN51_067221 [Arachis hypogaea]